MPRHRSNPATIGTLVLTLTLTLAPAGPARAQDCPGLAGQGSFGTHNRAPYDVVVVGDHAYTADLFGLTIYDVSDPAAPVKVGEVLLPEEAWDVVVSGDIAYVADGDSGLQVVDVADPANPVLLGGSATTDSARGVAVSGGIAYVADGHAGLLVFDVTDPANPVLLGSFFTGGSAGGITVAGDTAYLAAGNVGLMILDVTDPGAPSLLGSYDTPGWASAVAVAGNVVHVADGTAGFLTVDVTDPASPSLLGSYATPDSAMDVALSGSVAHVADRSGGLLVLDVTDPSNPALLGSSTAAGGARGLAVSGTVVHLAAIEPALAAFDVTDPSAPSLLGSVDTSGTAYGVAVSGSRAYVANGEAGLWILDVADPSAPALLGSYQTAGETRSIAVAGNLAYVGNNGAGLEILDVTDPSSPTLLGSYAPLTVRRVAVSAGVAYVATWNNLAILDVTDPADPALLGWYTTPGNAYDVAVSGNVVYVADDWNGLVILDVTDPADPQLLASYQTPGFADGVAVSGGVAYIADFNAGLHLVDVTDPSNPVGLGRFQTPSACTLAVSGSVAFVADCYFRSLVLVDVTDPTDPAPIDRVATGRGPREVGLDPATGMAWLPADVVLEEVRVGCPSCAGLQVAADPVVILTGGETSTVTVTVTDPFGDPVPGQAVTGATGLGTLSAFVDNGDGSYSATLTSGGASGTADITVSVNGITCFSGARVTIRCAAGAVDPPANLQAVVQADDSIGLSWEAAAGAVGYRVYRDGARVAVLGAGTLAFTDTGLEPRTRYCYAVGAVDSCGGVWTGDEICVTTGGDPTGCPALAARSGLDYTAEADLRDVMVRDGLAFGADRHGLGVWDVSDPENPVHLGHWHAPSPGRAVAPGPGKLVLLAAGAAGLIVLDLSDPARPVKVGAVSTPGDANGVTTSGDLAFVTDGDLQIVGLDDPANPVLLGSFATPGVAAAVVVSGGVAHVADGYSGLLLLDVTDPAAPAWLGSHDTPGSAWGVAVSGNVVYVADSPFFEVFTTECRAPAAEFAWDGAGLAVEFRNRSLYGATSWSWDFGDGATSTEQHPSHACAEPGIFTVTLTVTNDLGADTVSRQVMVSEQVFDDVPPEHWAFHWINFLHGAGVTSGYSASPMLYCPADSTTRGQMAVFLLVSREGTGYTPPPAAGLFDDVPVDHPFAPWIEELANRGITAGCSADPPLYCPDDEVSRGQMAVFLLATLEGAGWAPPPAAGVFDDVPASSPFAPWIEELANRGITAGCSTDPPLYCPADTVNRAQMAVFLVSTFDLAGPN